MKINWSFIEPVRNQAARLRGDFIAKSEIVKLAEQQAEIERLREENARLREALKIAADFLDDAYTDIGRDEYKVAGFVARAAIREGGKDDVS